MILFLIEQEANKQHKITSTTTLARQESFNSYSDKIKMIAQQKYGRSSGSFCM